MAEFLKEDLMNKWGPVIDHPDLPKIQGTHKRAVTAHLLEQQEASAKEQGFGSGGYSAPTLLGEAAPVNATGSGLDTFDPVLISLVRRSMPNLIAYDICGVQPMSGPSGLIFALRPQLQKQGGDDAFLNEANTSHSAQGDLTANTINFTPVIDGAVTTRQVGSDPTDRGSGTGYTVSTGMTTALGEALGDSAANQIAQMAFSIEKVTVTAVTRALKAEYTMELAQDLKAIHGLDAETELSNILSNEILAEINREVVRTINYTATAGAQNNTATAGTFNMDTDSNGRWSVERFKGLIFQIDRDANEIAKATRRGKGNVLICGSDVASALQMAGVLDYAPALSADLNVDDSGNTFAGTLNGRIKVYVDPYFATAAGDEYYTVGYKGASSFDAGLFYCPYVPLQMVRAVGENTFQPKIGFKTRYGIVANPFATTAADGAIAFAKTNKYYRTGFVTNLM
jgi:hypothetical protein|tara:strand:+ start:801 stop:2165 length:1365 start_codon:yes stop_codon:yes gene_type:complete